MVLTKALLSGLVLASASALPSSGEQDLAAGVEYTLSNAFRRRMEPPSPKCNNLELTNAILNTSSCDELKSIPLDCMLGEMSMTAKQAMEYNAIYCKQEFDSHADYLTYLTECASDESICHHNNRTPKDHESLEDVDMCTEGQLIALNELMTYISTCDELSDLGKNDDFPLCDPGIGEMMEPDECTEEKVREFKKRLLAKVKGKKVTDQPLCSKGELKTILGMTNDLSTCDELMFLLRRMQSEDFKCSVGKNDILNIVECTAEELPKLLARIKRFLRENIAEAKETKGQLGGSVDSEEEPSAAPGRLGNSTAAGAVLLSFVASAALAALLL